MTKKRFCFCLFFGERVASFFEPFFLKNETYVYNIGFSLWVLWFLYYDIGKLGFFFLLVLPVLILLDTLCVELANVDSFFNFHITLRSLSMLLFKQVGINYY